MFSHSDTVHFQAHCRATQTPVGIHQRGRDGTIIPKSFSHNFLVVFILILIFWLSCIEGERERVSEKEKVGCCKLGHVHPILVERTRRALQSRAVCCLGLQHDSKRAIECLRSYLGVKAVVRVLRGKGCEATSELRFCSGCSHNLSKINVSKCTWWNPTFSSCFAHGKARTLLHSIWYELIAVCN